MSRLECDHRDCHNKAEAYGVKPQGEPRNVWYLCDDHATYVRELEAELEAWRAGAAGELPAERG